MQNEMRGEKLHASATVGAQPAGHVGDSGKSRGASLPAAGDLIAAELIATVSREEAADLFAGAALPLVPVHDVEIYKIAYLTTDEWGTVVNASGALVVPQDLRDPAPLLSYQHGTTTLRWDVASTAPAAGERYRRLDALLFGTAGYVTALPDYLGYGDSGHRFHPYLHAETLASSVVDFLKSAKALCAGRDIPLSDKLFLAGYSEGGYATMAATREIQENHPELAITASAPMAGPYDLSGTLREILQSEIYPGAAYVAFAFWAYDKVYALDQLHQVITPAYLAGLDALFGGTQRLVSDEVPALPNDISALFQHRFLNGFLGDGYLPLKARIRENDLHGWTPAVPVRLIHSRSDEIVAFRNSLTAFHSFDTGTRGLVELVAATPDGNHGDCALPALVEAKAWFDSLK